MARIAARDQRAVGDLYDRHCRLVFGLALHILTERAEAEAVVEEVFLGVWAHPEIYHVALGSPASWLVRLTRNRATDHRRTLGLHIADCAPVSADSSEIGRALGTLSDQQRGLIEHAYFGGVTRPELAAQFGLSLAAVTESLRASMQTLRKQLHPSQAPQVLSTAHRTDEHEWSALPNPVGDAVSPVTNDRRSTPAHLVRELGPLRGARLGTAADVERRTRSR